MDVLHSAVLLSLPFTSQLTLTLSFLIHILCSTNGFLLQVTPCKFIRAETRAKEREGKIKKQLVTYICIIHLNKSTTCTCTHKCIWQYFIRYFISCFHLRFVIALRNIRVCNYHRWRKKSASYLIPPTDIEKCEKKKKHSLSFQWLLRTKLQGEHFRHGSPGNSKTRTMWHATQKSQHTAFRDHQRLFLKIVIKATRLRLMMQL